MATVDSRKGAGVAPVAHKLNNPDKSEHLRILHIDLWFVLSAKPAAEAEEKLQSCNQAE